MNYVAIVNGEERDVEIHEVSTGRFQITMDGRRFEVDSREISDTTLSFLADNQAYNIELERDAKAGHNLLVRGNVVNVEVLDLRRMSLRRAQAVSGAPEGPAVVSSSMPGKVVAVMVKDGDEVTAGQGLVVVEAMKMENELRSPKDGVVKNITAVEGEAVEGGVALCVVE